MNKKNISAHLRKKVEDWLSSIEDKVVKDLAERNTIVTGGCIASMLLGDKIHDYDIYFSDFETTIAVAKYYVNKFKELNPTLAHGIRVNVIPEKRVTVSVQSGGIASEEGKGREAKLIMDSGNIEDLNEQLEDKALSTPDEKDKPKYRPIFLSSNAITLSNFVQIIIRFYGEPDQIHENYDFVHCTNYWTSYNHRLVLQQDALDSLLAKELRYVGSKYPVCSIFRLRKFLKRGFYINAGQLLKICMQISKLDLENMETLREQLTGVDCTYFSELIDKAKEKDPDKVDSAFLVEVIENMFEEDRDEPNRGE